jgi:hypothetical protein
MDYMMYYKWCAMRTLRIIGLEDRIIK